MEIKKIIAALSVIVMSAAMFTACGGSNDSSSSSDSSATEAETQEESATEAETTEAATEEEKATEEETEAETSEENSSDADTSESGNATTDFGDITISMDASESTEEAPVKFGEWATIGAFSAQDKIYHNVALRITKVTTATDDQKYIDDAIDLNNDLCSGYGKIDVSQLKIPSDCELCVVDYEIHIPADFPSAEWGVVSPSFSLSVDNTDGAGFPSADGASSYIGLSTTTSLSVRDDTKYQVGETYAFRSLYIMVKGYDKIAYKISACKEGTVEVSDGRYDAYFASK